MRCVLDYATEDDVYVSRGSYMYAMYTAYKCCHNYIRAKFRKVTKNRYLVREYDVGM